MSNNGPDHDAAGENMDEGTVYECDECQRKVKGRKGKRIMCCGKPMREVGLPECTRDPSFAEHARFGEPDEPCDPGTGSSGQ